ncbi:hypothetical protein GDO86_004843 [Hymenochirus boettgeri]|uniref:Nuclear mitotic apparatus protein 1 n=1 Tax=Hymenochirus boettgeri TaxID=247094 RepID=A0A8T2K6N7_9PIPI|nr:hypothetical protein GDO86_004843 [Hymenochirus boettgeri]
MSPNAPLKRKTEVRFLELHRVASSSAMKSLSAPSSPMVDVFHTPQFQMRRLRKRLSEVEECRDELEMEIAEIRKQLAEKDSQISLLQQRIEHLRLLRENQAEQQEPKELEELREKNENLMIRLHDTLKQCQDMKTDRKQLERRNDQLVEENGELSYKVRDLSNRLTQLQEALYETTEEHENSLAAWQQKQSKLESELGTTVNEKKYLEEHHLILQGKISLLEDQIKKLGEGSRQEKGDCMGDVLKLEELNQEVSSLKEQTLSLSKQIHQLENEKKKLEELETQRSRFENEKSQLQEIVTNLQTSLSEMTFQKERQENEARAQEERLTCQITTLKLEISKLKSSLTHKDEEMKELHCKVEEEKREKCLLAENVKKQEDSLKELGNQVDHLGSMLKASESKMVALTGKLEDKTREVELLREEQHKCVNERDSSIAALEEFKCTKEEEVSDLKKTYNTLEKTHHNSLVVVDELEREKAELTLKIQELDATILDLIAKCQNLDFESDSQSKAHAATVESLKAQLTEQENQLKLYEQQVSSGELLAGENSKLKEQLLSMEDSVKHLEELLEREKEGFASVVEGENKRTFQFEEEMKRLSESRDEEKAKGERFQSRLRHFEEEHRISIESLQAKLTEMAATIKQRDVEMEDAKNTKSEQLLKLNQLEADLSAAYSQIKEREAEGLKLQTTLQSAEEKHKIAHQEESLRLSELESALNNARCDLERLSNELSDERCKKETLKLTVQQLEEQKMAKISSIESEMNAALNAVRERENEAHKLSEEVEDLKRQLEESSRKHQDILAQQNIKIKRLSEEKSSTLEQQQERIRALEADMEKERHKSGDLMKQLENIHSIQVKKETELEALKKELIHKVQELEQTQKSFEDSNNRLCSLLTESQETEQLFSEAKEQAGQYQKEIEKKNKEMSILHAELKSLNSKLNSKEQVSVEFQERLSKETNRSRELEDQLKKLCTELEASGKELQEKKRATDQLRTESLGYKEEADKQKMAVDYLKQQLSSQTEANDRLQKEIKAWREKVTQKEERIHYLQENLSTNQTLLEELPSLKIGYQEMKAEQAQAEERHQKEILSHKMLTEQLQAELEKTKGEMTLAISLKDQFHNQELFIQKLQSETSENKGQILQLQQMNSQLLSQNQSLTQVSEQGTKRLESELSKLTEQHRKELESLCLRHEKDVAESKAQLQDLGHRLETVNGKYDHVKTKVLEEREKFQEERHKLLLQVEQLEAAKKEQTEQVQELNKQLSQQEKALHSQQYKLKEESDTHEEVERTRKKVSELKSQLEEQTQAVEHYKSQMEKAKVHYDAKKQQNLELSEELQSRMSEQDQLRKEIAELKAESERLNKELQLSLLQSKEVEQNSKILANQVRTLEAQVEFADRQLRELGKFQLTTDAMKSRETLCPPRATRNRPDVSIDSLDLSFEEEHPLNSTSKNVRGHQEPARIGSLESPDSGKLPKKVESLESLYFTPIPTRVQSKLESSIGSIGDLTIDSSKKTRSARRRTTQVINITMTKKTKEEPELESANTSFYSLRSAPSQQNLNQQNARRGGRPYPAASAPALSSLPSMESLGKTEQVSSDDSLNNSILMNLPGYRPTTRSSARLSQAGGRTSFYMGTCQDEPEPLDDWNRIAELQQRNRICPPHLKTSYPLESRPPITDEEVKTGDPNETLRRVTLLPSQIQESTSSSRRMTLAMTGAEQLKGTNITTRQQVKRVSEESHHGPDTPDSKKLASCFPRPMTPKDKHETRKLSTLESKAGTSQQQSRRQSTAFSIFNTPKKLGSSLLKRGLNKKTATPKNSPRNRGAIGNTSKSTAKSPHLSIRKSPSRRSPRVSTAKSPKASGRVGPDVEIQFFDRKQHRNK